MYIESWVTWVCKYIQGGSVTVAILILYNIALLGFFFNIILFAYIVRYVINTPLHILFISKYFLFSPIIIIFIFTLIK